MLYIKEDSQLKCWIYCWY